MDAIKMKVWGELRKASKTILSGMVSILCYHKGCRLEIDRNMQDNDLKNPEFLFSFM